jgi:hypothetical protein
MFGKKILLISGEGEERWLEEETNGSLWESDVKIFPSIIEAGKKDWKVDAVKVAFDSTDENKKC